ncbi:MAG: hypothetical protein JWO97_4328 [Acidobacteria bacterium]|nr:hypothetical protein [Acidobacteriota bacterium]
MACEARPHTAETMNGRDPGELHRPPDSVILRIR